MPWQPIHKPHLSDWPGLISRSLLFSALIFFFSNLASFPVAFGRSSSITSSCCFLISFLPFLSLSRTSLHCSSLKWGSECIAKATEGPWWNGRIKLDRLVCQHQVHAKQLDKLVWQLTGVGPIIGPIIGPFITPLVVGDGGGRGPMAWAPPSSPPTLVSPAVHEETLSFTPASWSWLSDLENWKWKSFHRGLSKNAQTRVKHCISVAVCPDSHACIMNLTFDPM